MTNQTEYNKLKSGEYYSLAQLFSGDRKIIIPDLQRDYCWGDKSHGENNFELVTGFVNNLIDAFSQNEGELTLGLMYAYEHPDYHIQLCDGQQRLTTLYLLLGMLNRKTSNTFQQNLISDFELNHDDKEPYLQYAIRESTLYFLGDLVNEFFLQPQNGSISSIKTQDWYFAEYDQDSSIQSMLKAIASIDKQLTNNLKNEDIAEFGEYILNKLKFIYYDMGTRESGEKTFVVINTTGEPLTSTENLKPILIGNIADEESRERFSQEWENRETYFWVNRKKESENTGDDGLSDFLSWVIKIFKRSDKVDIIKDFQKEQKKLDRENNLLNKIESYFTALTTLINLSEHNEKLSLLFSQIIYERKEKISINLNTFRSFSHQDSKQQQQVILLPLLHFMVKISSDVEDVYQFLRRLRKNYFDKIRADRSGLYVDWYSVLQIIDNSLPNVNAVLTYDLENITDIKPKTWFNIEEAIKYRLKTQNSNSVNKIEEWEDHNHFMGDLSPLFKVYNQEQNFVLVEKTNYNASQLAHFYKTYLDFINLDNKTTEYKNHYFLLRLCSDYSIKGFRAGHWYFGIQKKDYLIHCSNWFYQIWSRISTVEDISQVLKSITSNIFKIVITNLLLNDDILQKDLLESASSIAVDREIFNNFEKACINSLHEGNYSLTLEMVFVWMYLEVISSTNKGVKIPINYPQIGVRLFNQNLVNKKLKYSLSNIRLGFHWPGGWAIETNGLNLMNKISNIQTDETKQEEDRLRLASKVFKKEISKLLNFQAQVIA